MKKIIKVGEFEFMILIILDNCPFITATLISRQLRKRYKKDYSKGYISKELKKLRDARLISINGRQYELTKNGQYYVELYDKIYRSSK